MLRTLAFDANSFFASCEQQDRPELRGLPIGVAPVMADTSCIIAASRLAKLQGVKTGTGVAEARILCPTIRIVEARPRLYIDFHHRLLAAIEQCIHVSEVRSIDEVECALTSTFAPRDKAERVAREIKARIRADVGECMTSSIGLAPNWFLAKLATDLQKPDGLVVIDEDELPQRLLNLKIDDFLGIGPQMSLRLQVAGIDSVAKLYGASSGQLRNIWGSVEGERMHGRLRGQDIPTPCERNKSVGHSHVLPPMLRTPLKAHAVLHRLMQKAAMRLRVIGHFAAGLSVFIAFRDGSKWTDDIRLTETQDTIVFTDALNRLLDCPAARRTQPVQVAITLIKLLPMRCHTPDLFEPTQQAARERLHHAVDTLNQVFGNGSVYFGGAFGATDYAPMRISYTCIPDPNVEELDKARAGRLRPNPPPPVPDS